MKILFLTSRVPYPLDKGDKLRAYYQIRELSKSMDIYLCCINDESPNPEAYKELKKYCKEVHFFQINSIRIFRNLVRAIGSRLPFHVAYFYDRRHKSRIEEIHHRIQPDRIFCQLIRMAPYCVRLKGSKTIDFMDVFSQGINRRMKKASLLLKPLFYWESKKLSAYEKYCFKRFDKHIIISEADRQMLSFSGKEKIKVIPNGVNFDFFSFKQQPTSSANFDLVFVGNMSYAPNIMASQYLAKEIMPLLWKQKPEVTLLLAGTSPDPKVKALHSDRVFVSGYLEDIREAYKQANVFVAPMQIGTGLQNKILEAMALKTPCITSTIGAKGVLAPEDCLKVAETKEEYVAHILSLLSDEKQRNAQAEAAFDFVQSTYHWEHICADMRQILSS